MNALIGSSGFVGSSLRAAMSFDVAVHRPDVHTLQGQSFQRLVCAGLPAAKWLANRDPAADLANMQSLCSVLRTVRAEQFVLISTVDVYPTPQDLDESHDCSAAQHHAYGAHRSQFETFVRGQFPQALIVRLPALFGPGLKKNVIFDLLHDNCLDAIQPRSTFQWYPLAELPTHLQRCAQLGLSLVNLVPEPVATADIIAQLFPGKAVGAKAGAPVHYSLRSRHAQALGGSGGYTLSAAHVLSALRAFTRKAA